MNCEHLIATLLEFVGNRADFGVMAVGGAFVHQGREVRRGGAGEGEEGEDANLFDDPEEFEDGVPVEIQIEMVGVEQ